MSFYCQQPLEPNVGVVDRLYDAASEDGHIYLGNGTLPHCSSTDPPRPNSCVVCSQKKVYAVCSDLLNKVTLLMEGDGQVIELIQSDCPGLSATNDSTGDASGEWQWQWLLLLLLLLIPIVIFVWFVSRKWKQEHRRGEENPNAESIL